MAAALWARDDRRCPPVPECGRNPADPVQRVFLLPDSDASKRCFRTDPDHFAQLVGGHATIAEQQQRDRCIAPQRNTRDDLGSFGDVNPPDDYAIGWHLAVSVSLGINAH